MRIENELQRGIDEGLVPRPEEPDDGDAGGVAVTAPPSWWFSLDCRSCGHTFRRGDRVRVDAENRTAEHLEPGLGCAGGPAAERTTEADEFAAGLLSAWTTDAPVVRLADGDPRLPRPGQGPAPRCLHCANTFRPGEYVVVCPCHRDDPVCDAAVHRDPARGLPCWERWRPDGTVTICPVAKARADGNG
ncbi:hypothetical protein AGRA3207_000873 [Actinomadura graeca]|uniref:Uncharacterized protein n=1 Tax=Actinomadura graeca TaxID=2750812 RepID=A0ABX8QP71_9ACTN|nr:hypothetical protein [Actinomadura graeca]QXJ20201.1 hypothetical protein AGRA3207_000873 [Actinomadura graeca]